LKLEKVTMFIILTMIVLVGALNIISSLVMMVMEKTRDIAILRTMGASAKNIMSIFIFQGLFVGLVGTVLGLVSGSFLCHILARYKFIKLPPDVYYITTLPVRMEWLDIVSIILAAIIISFLATIYPSWQAAKVNPVEALRYE
jgi:lipoprotein-releasing system permease protein